MQYIKVAWHHSHLDEPVLLLGELDDARYEVRKVEIFRDESFGFADRTFCSKSTQLGAVPVPALVDIARDPEFEPSEISKKEFEEIWQKATEQQAREREAQEAGVKILRSLDAIRRRPDIYLGGRKMATGELLASRMMEDLMWLAALPAEVDRIDQWWIIRSRTDWLARPDGSHATDLAFSRIRAFPEAGANSHHSEILLTVFADAVITSGRDGTKRIKGSPTAYPAPMGVDLARSVDGRVLAFALKK